MKRLILLCALLIASVSPAAAQTSITTTTLTNAITGSSTVGQFNIVVGSATGITANSTYLYIDGSVYRVNAVSGTTITVTSVALPATHNASVTVYVVPIAAQAGHDPVGSCIRGTAGAFPQYSPYTIMFNAGNGNMYTCRDSGSGVFVWRITNPYCNTGGSCSGAPPQTP